MTAQFDRRSFLLTTGAALAASPALAQASAEDAKLRAQLDKMFEALVDDSPEFATQLGMDKGARAGMKAQLDDNSLAAKARNVERSRKWVAELKAIDRAKLSSQSKVDLDVVLYQQERSVYSNDRYKFGSVGGNYSPYAISQRTGSYQDIPDFLDSNHKVENATDAEAYLSRLSAFKTQLDQDLERYNHDVALGAVAPDFVFPLAIGQIKALRDQPAARTVMVTSIVGKAQKANLSGDWGGRAQKIVEGEIFPALDRQIAALEAARKKARPDTGAWALPNGEAYYADAVKNSTTTNYTPEEVHQMGLRQVAEITAQIDTILKAQGMTQGSVSQRLMALNNDPKQLYPNTDEGRAQIIADLNKQIADLDPMLTKVFLRKPKAPVEVRRVPAFIQDGASNGYYQSPALDGSRPGAFYINLKTTADWPRYNLPSLTYHEAAPGHHFQIALAQENTNIPILRRAAFGFSAYSEGWGLYAEQLADEMGAYANDPLGRAGYLQSMLFRAARLVCDTGIHAKRWTVEQATQYFVDTIGNTRTRAQREVERYFVSPGQANSYKVGHNMWVKVREEAKAKLGPKFSIAEFHDAGLSSGSMPLTVLERRIGEWVASKA